MFCFVLIFVVVVVVAAVGWVLSFCVCPDHIMEEREGGRKERNISNV